MIVDDHPVLLRGLRDLLLSLPEFEVVAEAGSGEEAVRLFEQVRPDIVLMDLLMPGMGGVAAIRAIRAMSSDARIIALSASDEGDLVHDAFEAGAIGYQLKASRLDDLIKAIRQSVAGIPSLSSGAAQALVQSVGRARRVGENLTAREREVLALLIQGYTNAEIADQMVVAVATVKFHLRSIRSKLGTTSRTETVVVALQNRLG